MKKLTYLFICLYCVALLAGCENAHTTETTSDDSIIEWGIGTFEFPNNLTLDTWNPTIGQPSGETATPIYLLESTFSGEVWIDETQYVPLSYFWNHKNKHYRSGWKIQLDKLYRVGIQKNYYIYADDCEDPRVIYTHDMLLGDVALYFRPDISEKGVAFFPFDEFRIIENNSPYNIEDIRLFWNMHTGDGEYDAYTPWADGSLNTKSYYVMLEHKDFPAITYQMKFCIFEDFGGINEDYILIEHLNTNTVVFVDLAKEKTGWKTVDG